VTGVQTCALPIYSQNNLAIEYSAVTFKNADEIMYQYKLEGTNDDWSALSERDFMEYASLRPGKYTFKVRAAMLGTEAKVGEETTLTFRILPAFYQTVWFYSLIAIGILLLFYAFHKYRMQQAIKMERMRLRIASDLHDDIGSTLSSISMLSEIASQQEKEAVLVKALSKIGENSRDVLNSMDDIIWSVNPQNDLLSSLVVRLREYTLPVCKSKNILFSMHVEEVINTMKLGMDERRNIYLIVKEAINNAIKHSGCTQLSVAFILNHNQLEIKVSDNGCGFDPAIRGLRNGITNMERRAKQFGLEFVIKSEKNSGTHILLKTKNRGNA
jgi:signal transduction histidine kinase